MGLLLDIVQALVSIDFRYPQRINLHPQAASLHIRVPIEFAKQLNYPLIACAQYPDAQRGTGYYYYFTCILG
jgi:hypothetical protein